MAATLALGDPRGRTVGRAALAGAAFGGVCLCLPAALFLLPVVAVALAVHPVARTLLPGRRPGRRGRPPVVVVAPWWRWVHERFGTWAPAAELRLPPSTVAALAVPVLVVAAVGLVARRTAQEPAPGS